MNTNLMILTAAAVTFASCTSGGSATFDVTVKGLPDDAVDCYIEAMPISPIGDNAITDTVSFVDGHMAWSLPDNDTLYQVCFYPAIDEEYNTMLAMDCIADNDSHIEVTGEYTGNAIRYEISGDNTMAMYMARKMELLDKKMHMESDRERWMVEEEYRQSCVDYAKAHPSDDISAIYLALMADDATLAEYADSLADRVRHGSMSALIDVRLTSYDHVSKVRDKGNAPRIGSAMPRFACRDIDGGDISLDQFDGKYVVLDFWGSWCRWCMAGIEPMGRLYHDNKDKMVLIGVNSRDDEATYRKAIADKGMDWPQISNEMGEDCNLAMTYAVEAYPTKVVIAPDGTLALYWEGEDEEFYEQMNDLLKRI